MKKFTVGLMVAVLFPVMAVAATSVDANSAVSAHVGSSAVIKNVSVAAGKPDLYILQMVRNGKVVAKDVVSVLPGKSSAFSNGVQRSFVSGSSTNAAGVTSLTPGYYTTGLSGVLGRSGKHPDDVHLSGVETVFLGMDTKGGVQFPNLSTFAFKQSVTLLPGQELDLSGYSKGGGTTELMVTHE